MYNDAVVGTTSSACSPRPLIQLLFCLSCVASAVVLVNIWMSPLLGWCAATTLTGLVAILKLRGDNPWKNMGMKLGFKKLSGAGSGGDSRDPEILGLDD